MAPQREKPLSRLTESWGLNGKRGRPSSPAPRARNAKLSISSACYSQLRQASSTTSAPCQKYCKFSLELGLLSWSRFPTRYRPALLAQPLLLRHSRRWSQARFRIVPPEPVPCSKHLHQAI